MPKPDYKKVTEDLIKILKITPEIDDSSIDNGIIDVTENYKGFIYQFTENDLLVIKDASKGESGGEF
tara:strand:- start:278 stop:478 length:201 start_codon:yes stop_codon:yes gene_type:complete